jgi:hypothetical protein
MVDSILLVLLLLQAAVLQVTAFCSSKLHTSTQRVVVANTARRGVAEWQESQEGPTRQLGCLPFSFDDVPCVGETRKLHLYEARFLALFETALHKRGGCVGACIFSEDGGLLPVAALCDIVGWDRRPVGVEVILRCVGRAQLFDLAEVSLSSISMFPNY